MQPVEKAVFEGSADGSVRYTAPEGGIEIRVCDPRIVRVRMGEGSGLSYLQARQWPAQKLRLSRGEPATLSTPHLALAISASPFRLSLARTQGGETLLGDGTIAIPGGGGAAPSAGRVQIRFGLPQGQHFYGLGHGGQQLDRLGGVRQLWNSHVGRGPGSDIAMPLLVSNRGYALFFDNPSDARITLGRSDEGMRLLYDAEGGGVDFYIVAAASTRDLMGAVAELLGRAPMPPRWYLGYLQSTRHFENTDEVRGLPAELRRRRIPCDGLIFLSTYGEALGWNRMVGHLEFEPTLWSDPKGLIDGMRAQHFEVMTHEYPVLHPRSPAFAEASQKGYLLDAGYAQGASPRAPASYQEGQRYIDFSNPQARKWWWEQHGRLRELGINSWWLDGGEGPPASSRLSAGPGSAVHNLYDLYRQQAFADGEAADRPDVRPVLLCRSGAAGMQRYGGTCWSGDVDNTFATLAALIPLGLNTGASGVPYWGTDIGGFFHPVPETAELFVRWYQFGAFCPIFRAHGRVWREHTPWAHGAEVEEICRSFAELRYRLLPYTYTLARQATELGLPLMRPLWLNYPDDPCVWDMGRQYLWGDDLLVAPVTAEGARRWPVYLPAGAWFDFWTQARYQGGRGVEVDAPLERMPLFVREGAIIPMGPVMQHVDEAPLDEVTLLAYPGAETTFELYEDDGRTNAWRRGGYAVTELRCRSEDGAVVIEIGEPRGDAGQVPAKRAYTLQVRMARVSAVEVEAQGGRRELRRSGRGREGWRLEGGFAFVRLQERAARVTLRP